MDDRTKVALQKSIEHWERLASGETEPGEFIGITDCALCQAFIGDVCKSCPVREATGQTFCHGSPYDAADQAGRCYGLNSEEFKKVARDELAFLRGLYDR
jgi:hypothetical protein